MKVGIVTFNGAHNYGAVLQAWSLQEYLISQGHTVEIINYRIGAVEAAYRLFEPESPYKDKEKNLKHQKKQYQAVRKAEPLRVASYERFETFIAEQLNVTVPYNSLKALQAAKFDYDALIVGSDQVWNSVLTRGLSLAYLLDFGPENARRISYAPSRGDKKLLDQEKIIFERKLFHFDFISVREEDMLKEFSQLTDQEIAVVSDPTLLLEREQFDRIRTPYAISTAYIYVHNVHVDIADERMIAVAEALSQQTGLPIVMNRDDGGKYNNLLKVVADIGPREFLDVVANAEYVVTNSFHTTVFSIIYERKFITVPSLRNPERMIRLLGRLQLSDHLIDKPELLPKKPEMLGFDSKKVMQLKEECAGQSKAFLAEALREDYVREPKAKYAKTYLETGNAIACSACGVCIDEGTACGNDMKPDAEGFLYPADEARGTDCVKRCMNRQDLLADYDMPAMYTAEITLDDPAKSRFYSGEINCFCEAILAQGGAVVARVMDGATHACYKILKSKEELLLLYAGCLVEANVRQAEVCCRNALAEYEKVLFVGSPCEVQAVSMLVKSERLITLAQKCNGVISEALLQKYVSYLERKYHSKISELSYAKLIKGLSRPYTFIRKQNDEVVFYPAASDLLYNAYTERRICRPSCYYCIYGEKWNTAVDIALIRRSIISGSNTKTELKALIAVGSKAGEQLLRDSGLVFEASTDCMNSLLVKTGRMPKVRNEIMMQLETEEIQELLKLE